MEKKTKPIKERLNAHLTMLNKLATLKQELAFAEEQYGSVAGPNYSGMPRGGGSREGLTRDEAIVYRKIELEKKVAAKAAEVAADWAELEPSIEKLKPSETLLLRLRYYYGAEWEEVCRGIYGRAHDYDTELDRYMNRTFKMHGRALLELAEILG